MKLAAAIAALLLLVGCENAGRYQIVHDSPGKVWRVDTKTGHLGFCVHSKDDVYCSAPASAM